MTAETDPGTAGPTGAGSADPAYPTGAPGAPGAPAQSVGDLVREASAQLSTLLRAEI